MSSNLIIGPAHNVRCRDDTKIVYSQVMTPGNCGNRKLLGDQTNTGQFKDMAVAQQGDLEWQVVELAIFESTKEPGMFAVSSDTTGCNLPTCYAPWRNLNLGRSKRSFRKDSGISRAALHGLLKAVQADGFCLACTRSTFSRTGQDLSLMNEFD